MSLRWRFALLFAGGAVLATLLVGMAALMTTRSALESETDSFLKERFLALKAAFPLAEEAERIARNGQVELEIRTDDGKQSAAILFGPDAVVQWSDHRTRRPLITVRGAPRLPVFVPEGTAAGGAEEWEEKDWTWTVEHRVDDLVLGHVPFRMLTVRTGDGSLLSVARDVSEQVEVMDILGARILLTGLLVAAAAGAGGWLIARRLIRPMEILTEAAEEVAQTRELLEPIDARAAGEVGRLADSFNRMIAALRSSRDQQRRLIQDASHELRTPLASLRTNAEVLARMDELAPQERDRMLADIDHELRELSTLASELVDLASESGPEEGEPTVPIDLQAAAEAVVERAVRRSGRQITVTGEGGEVEAQPGALQRAVDNLVDNALKWGPPDRPVEVALDGGRLLVRDGGPGIPEDDLPHIFDRFYRAAEARSLTGSGLGLAIVKGIVERNGGRIHARNLPGGGAEVGFTLPL